MLADTHSENLPNERRPVCGGFGWSFWPYLAFTHCLEVEALLMGLNLKNKAGRTLGSTLGKVPKSGCSD